MRRRIDWKNKLHRRKIQKSFSPAFQSGAKPSKRVQPAADLGKRGANLAQTWKVKGLEIGRLIKVFS